MAHKAISPRSIFSGSHARAVETCAEQPDQPGHLIVAFDFAQAGRKGFLDAGRTTILGPAAGAVLRVQTARNDWYLNDDLPRLLDAIADYRDGFDRVTLLGFSMGGYGALLCSDALRADWAVLFSPFGVASVEKGGFDPSHLQDRRQIDPARDRLETYANPALSGLLLYDPWHMPDKIHAALIRQLCPALQPVILPGAGHPASMPLARNKAFGALAPLIGPEASDIRAIRRLYRDLASRSVHYWIALATQARRRGHSRLVSTAMRKAETIPLDDAHELFDAGRHFAILGETKGLGMMNSAIAMLNDPPDEWFDIAIEHGLKLAEMAAQR